MSPILLEHCTSCVLELGWILRVTIQYCTGFCVCFLAYALSTVQIISLTPSRPRRFQHFCHHVIFVSKPLQSAFFLDRKWRPQLGQNPLVGQRHPWLRTCDALKLSRTEFGRFHGFPGGGALCGMVLYLTGCLRNYLVGR